MKRILPFKLFESIMLSENDSFDEVCQTVKEILLEIEDMGIDIHKIPNYYINSIIFCIPSPYKNGTGIYSSELKMVLSVDIIEAIERVYNYCKSVGYDIKIRINKDFIRPGSFERNILYIERWLRLYINTECKIELVINKNR